MLLLFSYAQDSMLLSSCGIPYSKMVSENRDSFIPGWLLHLQFDSTRKPFSLPLAYGGTRYWLKWIRDNQTELARRETRLLYTNCCIPFANTLIWSLFRSWLFWTRLDSSLMKKKDSEIGHWSRQHRNTSRILILLEPLTCELIELLLCPVSLFDYC